MYEHLEWLPQPPAEFNALVAAASDGQSLRALANHRLNENQLRRLARRLTAIKAEGCEVALTALRLGLISNGTTQLISPVLIGTSLRYGIHLDVIETEFDQLAQEAFSPHSAFEGKGLDYVLIAITDRGLPIRVIPGDRDASEANVRECADFIQRICESLHRKTGAQIILQTIPNICETVSGSFERWLCGTRAWAIEQINQRIAALISEYVVLLDTAHLASLVGLSHWHDHTQWNLAKLSFSQRFNPIYAEFVCRILGARLGKSRRCLILDLDNTLWGGVIGDDGLAGIQIGNGSATGEAHLALQQMALDLRSRGVVLAVSSKNEETNARLPFKEHPDMLLQESDIAVFQANWADKATNIKAIADLLSLGLESLVFLDDNPAERLLVRSKLPMVAVPELPDDPAMYTRILVAGGYFESTTFSNEDRKRATFYQDNVKRSQEMTQSTNLHAYLVSLNMEMTYAPFDLTGRSRIAQLISKSNQFNLTTRRYSELDVKQMSEDSDNYFTRQFRLKDRFGDNGMICVVIIRKSAFEWHVDTWLMSCRVLGRRVEEAVLHHLVTEAAKAGVKKLTGEYRPTERNALVKDHYAKLGFTLSSVTEHAEYWELPLANHVFTELPMDVSYAV